MQVLASEGVKIDDMFAHGGMFRTQGVAQRLLAASINAPVSVGATASEGGAWGIAVLADFTAKVAGQLAAPDLSDYLNAQVFAGTETQTIVPIAQDVAGFKTYLERYSRGLVLQHAAIAALPNA